jgi:hypothetical protein
MTGDGLSHDASVLPLRHLELKRTKMTLVRMATALAFLCIATLACSSASLPALPTAPLLYLPTTPPPDPPIPTAARTETAQPESGPVPYVNMMHISQYSAPSGQPVQSWNRIPIMPQATVGQEFQSGAVYSFKATATISQAADFYQSNLHALGYKLYVGPATGTAGSGSNTIHSNFLGYSKGSHLLLIYIASYDTDTGHIFVVLSTQ